MSYYLDYTGNIIINTYYRKQYVRDYFTIDDSGRTGGSSTTMVYEITNGIPNYYYDISNHRSILTYGGRTLIGIYTYITGQYKLTYSYYISYFKYSQDPLMYTESHYYYKIL